MPKGVIKSYTNSKDTDKPLQYNGQEKKVKGQTKHYNAMAKRKRSQDRQNITIQWPREKGQRADKTLQNTMGVQ
jgi:hypothetical protein